MLATLETNGALPQMPKKNDTISPAAVVAKAVKRHLEGGESAVDLAQEYRVSRATIYNWVAAYERQLLERSEKQGMSTHDAELWDKRTLIAEIKRLKLENTKLKDKLVAMMIKAGEI